MLSINKQIKRLFLLFTFLLISYSFSIAQGTLLVKKGYKTKERFFPGQSITLKVENRYFTKITGIIEDIADDYIMVDGELIELDIILQVIVPLKSVNLASWGANILIGGLLYPVLYMVNGLLDGSKQYYSRNSLTTSAIMVLSGALLMKLQNKNYKVKKRYRLITIPVKP